MKDNLPVPGFTDSEFDNMNFDIPVGLEEAPDVSRLPESTITYADDDGASKASLRAYESATFTQPAQTSRPENMHEYFEREERDTGPSYSMESKGYHEPTWGDASAKTAERMNEAQTDVFGGGNVLSIFNTRPGESPETLSSTVEQNTGDDLTDAIISYIETFYSEQLKKCKPNFSVVLGKAVSKKIKEKILPDYFQKKVGDGTPKEASVPKVDVRSSSEPSKERFDFKKFVSTDF